MLLGVRRPFGTQDGFGTQERHAAEVYTCPRPIAPYTAFLFGGCSAPDQHRSTAVEVR
jgi:hypothetical protein